MLDIREYVRSSSSSLEVAEIVKKPVSELLGASSQAALTLGKFGIKTIFDLGTSNLFASARAAVDMSKSGNASQRFGIYSADLFTDDVRLTNSQDIAQLGVATLRIIPSQLVSEVITNFDSKSIHDLAHWPPSLAARKLIGEYTGSTLNAEDLQTEELRPRMGQYPTERVYYSTLTMLEMLGGPPANQTELTGSLSLTHLIQGGTAAVKPAIGAYLTFSQSWYSQGVTLGHMLHSLALAPGEATRVAVIDWSRRTSAFSSESIGESERLDNTTEHARALSEVQNAVSKDFQKGGSFTETESTSGSGGGSYTNGTGLISGLFASGERSEAYQEATTETQSESSSWSIGNRSVFANMTQNVNDRTEQHSSSVRNRRASAVKEVSQSEHESVSTRIVANYNHMHALTVQYYEVVQIYRTEAKLETADRCLFVPMETLDFSTPNAFRIVERFRAALIRSALNRRVRELLVDDTTSISINPVIPVKLPGRSSNIKKMTEKNLAELLVEEKKTGSLLDLDITNNSETSKKKMEKIMERLEREAEAKAKVSAHVWDVDAISIASRVLGRNLMRPNSNSLNVPDGTEIYAISFEGVTVTNLTLDHVGTASSNYTIPQDSARIDISNPIPMIELDSIYVKKTDAAKQKGSITLHCTYLGRHFTLPPIPITLDVGNAVQKIVSFSTDQADRRKEILDHLQAQRDYYSKAIFKSLDAAALTTLLSHYKWNGKPLIDIIEPKPLKVAGNYLILRAPVDLDELCGMKLNNAEVSWRNYLDSRGLTIDKATNTRLIPIPTGGVFAEAVLGRSNAAEKLDITRFWNWQDSPIPLTPTEIAPIGMGTRGAPDDTKPGQLSPPVLNIMNPTALPAPDSIGSVLNALSNMNFRDMSGLSGNQGLVKSGMDGTLAAATNAGQIASENMKTSAQKSVAMGQIASDLAKSAIAAYFGVPTLGGNGDKVKGISGDGARINHGKNMDDRGVTSTTTDSKNNATNAASGNSSTDTGGNGGATSAPRVSREAAYSDTSAMGFSPGAVNEAVSTATASNNREPSTEEEEPARFPYHEIKLVGQSGPGSCWAASMAMVMNYAFKTDRFDDKALVAQVQAHLQDPTYLPNESDRSVDLNNPPTMKIYADFIKNNGFQKVSVNFTDGQAQNFTVSEWSQMLQTFGPMMVTVTEQATEKHSVVLHGIKGNGRPEGTFMCLQNPLNETPTQFPNPGKSIEIPFKDFSTIFVGLMEVSYRDLSVYYVPQSGGQSVVTGDPSVAPDSMLVVPDGPSLTSDIIAYTKELAEACEAHALAAAQLYLTEQFEKSFVGQTIEIAKRFGEVAVKSGAQDVLDQIVARRQALAAQYGNDSDSKFLIDAHIEREKLAMGTRALSRAFGDASLDAITSAVTAKLKGQVQSSYQGVLKSVCSSAVKLLKAEFMAVELASDAITLSAPEQGTLIQKYGSLLLKEMIKALPTKYKKSGDLISHIATNVNNETAKKQFAGDKVLNTLLGFLGKKLSDEYLSVTGIDKIEIEIWVREGLKVVLNDLGVFGTYKFEETSLLPEDKLIRIDNGKILYSSNNDIKKVMEQIKNDNSAAAEEVYRREFLHTQWYPRAKKLFELLVKARGEAAVQILEKIEKDRSPGSTTDAYSPEDGEYYINYVKAYYIPKFEKLKKARELYHRELTNIVDTKVSAMGWSSSAKNNLYELIKSTSRDMYCSSVDGTQIWNGIFNESYWERYGKVEEFFWVDIGNPLPGIMLI